MPHIIKENHLEKICSSCKKPHGNIIEIEHHNHKIYEIITCTNCSYEIIRIRPEIPGKTGPQFLWRE